MELNREIVVSVVMPCLNEAETIGQCIDQALCFFEQAGLIGEIIVVDNGSTDGSQEIVKSTSARLVNEPKKGYGQAYIAGIAAARGLYIVMADSDGTYNLCEATSMLGYLNQGYDFVIGSRMQGEIQPDAMPWLHRYLGVPFLTLLIKVLFPSNISDAHSGMRAFTREAITRLGLKTSGMEFASEMIIEALIHKLNIIEIPITYYPRRGQSKLRTFRDGWRHLKIICAYIPSAVRAHA